jgi:serine/threonine-protein kinase
MTDDPKRFLPTQRVSAVDPVALTRPASFPSFPPGESGQPGLPGPGEVQPTTVYRVPENEATDVPPPSRADAYVGKTIDGRYVVEQVLGEGGMGIVYRGRHKVIDKKVAIKVLRGDMAKDKEITERFLQEARAASSIGNPHIIDISDFGQLPDGSTYFVMEYLEGDSLSVAIEKQRPMPVPRVLHIAKQIANGLSAAHASGIVHRDLKPDNIILINRGQDRDFVKVLDFGIAKVGAESKITRAGAVFGTPHYMSPEQAAGTSVDLRTDIYALGVILYELASGKVPFDADNFMGILTQHMYKAPVPLLATVPPPEGVPAGLDAIIQKCLSKKPEQRYASMDALTADLLKVERNEVPDALPEMMSRSGGFNVPADYFRTGTGRGMPALVPGMPRARRARWGVYAGVAGIATAVGLVVLIFARSATTHATAPVTSPLAASAAAVAQAPSAAASASAPASSAASAGSASPMTMQVLVGVEPADAKVTRDGQDLGLAPIALELATGETASLVVSRAGFKAQTVKVDGTAPRVLVKLVGAGGGRPKPAAGPKPAAPSGNGITDFQDPFLKK